MEHAELLGLSPEEKKAWFKQATITDIQLALCVAVRDGIASDATIEAVKQYKFKPALANNKPVAVWVAVPISFKLSGS